ncbi:SCO family protein [Agarilytica rhodophyticola]|uniref:SCO family protein n=1 Tax=Agarilytica rhodophyticola TaxID=1737490 RepID=UPI000B342DCB|nr:SCO family protein [Agarilytica rhodophyticola]
MKHKLIVLVIFLCSLTFISVNVHTLFTTKSPPKIQGTIIPNARDLEDFTLLNHNNEYFTNANLKGKWSLVSYGFTDCPDICPTTLNKLAQVKNKLHELGKYQDLNILFYSIDPQRDTVERLAQYVAFFSPDFLGLTWRLDAETNHIAFEKSLGITSLITPLTQEEAENDYKGYSVSHGVMLYLLNPEGKLQAIFTPETSKHGIHNFLIETIYRDYVAIRSYFGLH